jgi:hypothetical protein
LTATDRSILLTHWLAKAAKKTLVGDAKWKYFEHTHITADGSGDYLFKKSFVIPPPTFTGPHDLQPQPLDLGVHEELEDEPGVDEGARGA